MKTGNLGSISTGTLRNEDLIPALGDELESLILLNGVWLSKPEHFATRDRLNQLREDAREWFNQNEDNGADYTGPDNFCDGSELLVELADALNEFAPDYSYFGSHPGDGADFGFWLSEDWQQQAQDDGVLFVSDLADVPEEFRGLLCEVNDHGNATLYAKDAQDITRELWSVV